MELLTSVITRLFLVLFFLACLNVGRHSYYFMQILLTSTDENPGKYELNKNSLLILGISIAYILSVIFTFNLI